MEFIIETGLYRPWVKFFAMFEVVQHNLYSKHATKLMNELLGKKEKKRGCTYEQNDSR
jgi:phage terminase large subunit